MLMTVRTFVGYQVCSEETGGRQIPVVTLTPRSEG